MTLLLALVLGSAISKAVATQEQSSHYSCELFNTLPQHIMYGEDEDWTYLADTTSTSADGNVIATTGEPGSDRKRGRGILMTRRDKEYPWTTTVIEGEVENSRFGYDVSVAGNGVLLAVGAVWDEGTSPFYNSGGVYLYEVPISNTNVPFQKLIGDRPHIRNGDHFGHRVALDHDGNTLVVTAPHHGGINGNMRDTGALEVYKRANDIEQFVSVAVVYGDHATDRFGMGAGWTCLLMARYLLSVVLTLDSLKPPRTKA